MNKKQVNNTNSVLKVVISIIIVLMIAAIVLLALTKGCTDFSLFKKSSGNNVKLEDPAPEPGEDEPNQPGVDPSKYVFKPGESNLIRLMPTAISASQHTITLTATVEPEDALNQLLDWKVEFVNPDSAWATGLDVNNYVVITPESDGAKTAQLLCKLPFGEQIKLTVTSRANTDAYATCTVDCVKEVKITSFNLFTQTNYSYLLEDGAIPRTVMNSDSARQFLQKLLADGKPHILASIHKEVGTIDEEYTAEVSWSASTVYIDALKTMLPEDYQSKVSFKSVTTSQTLEDNAEFIDLVLEAPYLTFVDGYQGYVPGDLGSKPKDNTLNMSVTGNNIVEFYKAFGLIENDDEFYSIPKETVEAINAAFKTANGSGVGRAATGSAGITAKITISSAKFNSSKSIDMAFGERNFAQYAPGSVSVTPDQIVF